MPVLVDLTFIAHQDSHVGECSRQAVLVPATCARGKLLRTLGLSVATRRSAHGAEVKVSNQVWSFADSDSRIFQGAEYVHVAAWVEIPLSRKCRLDQLTFSPVTHRRFMSSGYAWTVSCFASRQQLSAFAPVDGSSSSYWVKRADEPPRAVEVAGQPVCLNLDNCIAPPVGPARAFTVAGAQQCLHDLLNVPFPLLWEVPALEDWPLDFRALLSSTLRPPDGPSASPQRLQIFTDGSCIRTEEGQVKVASWAFVVSCIDANGAYRYLVHQSGAVAPKGHELELPGLLQDHAFAVPDSFAGEVEAVYRALLWLLQSGDFHAYVPCDIISDALSAISIGAGRWAAVHRPFLFTHVRPLEKLASHLGILALGWQRAHSGCLFNELADHIAHWRAKNSCDAFCSSQLAVTQVSALPWLWMFVAAELQDSGISTLGDELAFPQPPPSGSKDMVLWPSVSKPCEATVQLNFLASTFNVNTLQQWTKRRVSRLVLSF